MKEIPKEIKEIKEARALLEGAERSKDPEEKARLLEEGLDMLDYYCEERQNLNEDKQKLICNVRISHTRRLLKQLLAIKKIDFDLWYKYINLINLRLNNERNKLFQEDPELEENYMEFFELYKEERAEALIEEINYIKSREP